ANLPSTTRASVEAPAAPETLAPHVHPLHIPSGTVDDITGASTTTEERHGEQDQVTTDASQTTESTANRLGAKGTGRTSLFDPWAVTIVGLDIDPLDLPAEEKAKIEALDSWEHLPRLAPYKIAGLKKLFAGNPQACAFIDAAIDSRATQPQ